MMGGRGWSEWISEYAKGHQNRVNQVTHLIGIPMIAVSLPLLLISLMVSGLWPWALGLFVAGWALQFIGHVFEGSPPEFFKDWRFLFVGLRWWLVKVLGKG